MQIDRLAPWYRAVEYAAFGRTLERCRCAFIDRLAGAQSVLILGEGDGRTLQRILRIVPQSAQIEVVELSPVMVRMARQRIGEDPRVRFRNEDATEAALGDYDAVVTNFFLDCFSENEARAIVNRLSTALRPGGLWLHGDFAIPERGWKRLHARLWTTVMYRFFRVTTGLQPQKLAPLERILEDAGLRPEARYSQRAGLVAAAVFRK